MSEPTWAYQVQYYIKTGETGTNPATPVYTLVDYDETFNPSRDISYYEPEYKARQNNPKYAVNVKTSVEFSIDFVESDTLLTFFKNNEDNLNVETEIIRVWESGEPTNSAYPAKKAAFVMNMNPLDGEAGNCIKATGTLDMVSDGWTAGTFNTSTKAFTPSA